MKKSFRNFAMVCLSLGVVLGTVNTSQAQSACNTCGPAMGTTMAPAMGYGYAPRVGPIRSLGYGIGSFLAYRPTFGYHRTYRAAYYPGTMYQPACNTGCSTGTSYYGGFGCNSCNSGCASGNCSSATTPATGMTPIPAIEGTAPVPTTTFKSTEPTISPEAAKDSKTDNKSNKNYDEKSSKPDGFSLPARPDEKAKPEIKPTKKPEAPETKTNAPPFGNPFGPKPTEALKVPTAPLVPVEKRKPAPADIEENGGVKIPSLQLIPAPIDIDESQVTRLQLPERTRVARSARFTIPQVARSVPRSYNSIIPPLPSPVQLAGK